MNRSQHILQNFRDDYISTGDNDDGIEIETILRELINTRVVTVKDDLSDLKGTTVQDIRILDHTSGTNMAGIYFNLSKGKSLLIHSRVGKSSDFKVTVGQRKK